MTDSKRDTTIDIAKGFAITAIVLGHVWRGLASAGLISQHSETFVAVDRALYTFHLTVFAFAAGLFVQSSIRKRGAQAYAYDRGLGFLWLYVLWSIINGAVKIALSSSVNNTTSLVEVLELWIPKAQYWFFGWILVATVLAALIQPWSSKLRATLSFAAASVLSLVLWGTGGTLIGTQGHGLTVYFWVAVLLGGARVIAAIQRTSLWGTAGIFVIAAGLMVALALLTPATLPTGDVGARAPSDIGLGVVASTAGLIAVLAVSKLLGRVPRVERALQYIGERSMAIFLAHVLFTAAFRIVLMRFGIECLTVHVLGGTLIGVVGPLVLLRLAQKLRQPWLFEKPNWLSISTPAR